MYKDFTKSRWSVLATLLFLIVGGVSCIPPKQPCDEKIDDPKIYEDIVLANPVIQQLNTELNLYQVNVSSCGVDHKAGIVLAYALPVSYSDYQLAYFDSLSLAYSEDGTVEVAGGIGQLPAFEKSAILDYFKKKIREVEGNARIKEVITKTEPDSEYHGVSLNGHVEIHRSNYNRIEYNLFYGLVSEYLLSNDIDWQEFPEIELAHKVFEENIYIRKLASCAIAHGNDHAYTFAEYHDSLTGPWFLTVSVDCDDGWKEVSAWIHNDGSYEGVEIRFEVNNK